MPENILEKKVEKKIKSKLEKAEKVSQFAVKLSELRKERGISQKKAAEDLGISQALLSHYEKGIRECGLDFVIKCGHYYGVTTDYLLGVSSSRNGIDSSFLNSASENGETAVSTLAQATKMILDIVSTVTNEGSAKYIYDYYVLSLYRGAVTMAKAGILPKEMFKIDYTLGRELASAAIAVQDARFAFIEDKSRTGTDLSERTALHNLIEQAEEHILNSFYLE